MPNQPVQIRGLDRLTAAFEKFPKEVARNMSQAAHESSNDVILPTVGLQRYPPSTDANQPPTPYYIRGTGMQTSPMRNTGKSENLGKQWTTKREGWTVRIGNRASYAKYVHGDEQAGKMAEKRWRKLYDVAKEKVGKIQNVYSAWVSKTLHDLGI